MKCDINVIMKRILQIISTINDVYAIRNNNYNNVLNRLDNILENTNYPISKTQINEINDILLSNNKNIDRDTLTKIINTLTEEQQNRVENQLNFLFDMRP